MPAAALEYLRATYGGDFEPVGGTFPTGAAAIQVSNNDPEVVSLTFINLGANPVFLAPTNKVSATEGVLLGSNGGLLSLTVRDDALLPTLDWHALSPAGASTVYVIGYRRYTALAK